ncbi:MAG: hypothetical protein AAGH78_18000 [Cyanobacteria bacterium P01_H01_bin.58]
MLDLPFYVKLNDFIVERNEGSESVAMWTSDVTLFDPVTDTAVRRSVWMIIRPGSEGGNWRKLPGILVIYSSQPYS